MDTALDDYLKRFKTDEDPIRKPLTKSSSLTTSGLVPLQQPDTSVGIDQNRMKQEMNAYSNNVFADNAKKPGLSGKNLMSGATALAPLAMGLLEENRNKEFEGEELGEGPGKAGTAIAKGALTGLSAGAMTGNVFVAAGAAVVGGVVGGFSHKKKAKVYDDKVQKNYHNKTAFENAKIKEQYKIEEGLLNMENLKTLRERQLGQLS
jgi:hypothetical protein